MNFKSRFEGKKSFINKRGDIVDSQSKEVTTLRKPLQQQQTVQLKAVPPLTPTDQQPFMKFLNQKTQGEVQSRAANNDVSVANYNSTGTFSSRADPPQQNFVSMTSAMQAQLQSQKDTQAFQMQMSHKLNLYNSLTPGPPTASAKGVQLMLPEQQPPVMDRRLSSPAKRIEGTAAPMPMTPQVQATAEALTDVKLMGPNAEKRVSVYAKQATQPVPTRRRSDVDQHTTMAAPAQQNQVVKVGVAAQAGQNQVDLMVNQAEKESPRVEEHGTLEADGNATNEGDRNQELQLQQRSQAETESPSQKRIRKIIAPNFSLSKRSNLNLVKSGISKASQSESRRNKQNLDQQKSTQEHKSKDAASQHDQVKTGSKVVIKKTTAASQQSQNVAGGYTPTILARNQFVPIQTSQQVRPPSNHIYSNEESTVQWDSAQQADAASLTKSPAVRFKLNQFQKTAKFGGSSQEQLHVSSEAQQQHAAPNAELPTMIHGPNQAGRESEEKELIANFQETTKPLLMFQGVQMAQAQPSIHLLEEQKSETRSRQSPPRYQTRNMKSPMHSLFDAASGSNTTTNCRRQITIELESSTSLLKKTKDLSYKKGSRDKRQSPTSSSVIHQASETFDERDATLISQMALDLKAKQPMITRINSNQPQATHESRQSDQRSSSQNRHIAVSRMSETGGVVAEATQSTSQLSSAMVQMTNNQSMFERIQRMKLRMGGISATPVSSGQEEAMESTTNISRVQASQESETFREEPQLQTQIARVLSNSPVRMKTEPPRHSSVSPNKSRRETQLNNLSQRRQSAAVQPSNNNITTINFGSEVDQKQGQEEFADGSSIFSKFKKKFGEVTKRPGFMQMIKLDSQVSEDNRNGLIMTPNNQPPPGQTTVKPSEMNQSKGDLNNSSHYYRFKRHSLGYQSQGPPMGSLKTSLMNIEAMNPISGGREQSQTASGAGAFSNVRMKAPPQALLNQAIFSPTSVPAGSINAGGRNSGNSTLFQQSNGGMSNLLSGQRGGAMNTMNGLHTSIQVGQLNAFQNSQTTASGAGIHHASPAERFRRNLQGKKTQDTIGFQFEVNSNGDLMQSTQQHDDFNGSIGKNFLQQVAQKSPYRKVIHSRISDQVDKESMSPVKVSHALVSNNNASLQRTLDKSGQQQAFGQPQVRINDYIQKMRANQDIKSTQAQ